MFGLTREKKVLPYNVNLVINSFKLGKYFIRQNTRFQK